MCALKQKQHSTVSDVTQEIKQNSVVPPKTGASPDDLKKIIMDTQEMLVDALERNNVRSEYKKRRELFWEYLEDTNRVGDQLERSSTPPSDRDKEIIAHTRIYLFGFVEGDFSSRHFIPSPLMGGFLLQTPNLKILFEPGAGTREAMRQFNLSARELDAIVISHIHQTVRQDFHNLMNDMGAIRLAGDATPNTSKHIVLFSSRAAIEGRDNNHSILIPPYDKIISNRFVVYPRGDDCYLIRKNSDGSIQTTLTSRGSKRTIGNPVIIEPYPAYHIETGHYEDGGEELVDHAGVSGNECASYLLRCKDGNIFYSADTQCTPEYEMNLSKLYESLTAAGQGIDVLIVNMKTIGYRPLEEFVSIGGMDLPLTSNQLGFAGTILVAKILKPQVLVLRGIGMECLVRNEKGEHLTFTTDKLSLCRKLMSELLGMDENNILIPARLQLELIPDSKSGKPSIVQSSDFAMVPLEDPYTVGDFVTTSKELRLKIDEMKQVLRKPLHKRPFYLIQGASGTGKSFLARSVARELIIEHLKREKLSINEKEIKSRIRVFDLSMPGKSKSDLFVNTLMGWSKARFFAGDSGCLGLLSGSLNIEGNEPETRQNDTVVEDNCIFLILNQLEKMKASEAARFLDVLEDWEYKRQLDTKLMPVGVRIIFTTNKTLDSKDLTIPPDMKNRLQKFLTLPTLSELSVKQRRNEIAAFVSRWSNKERVVIDSPALSLLMQVDLKKGEYRTLRDLLMLACYFIKNEYAIVTSTIHDDDNAPVLVMNEHHLSMAINSMKLSTIVCEGSQALPPPPLATLLTILFIGNHFDKKAVYSKLNRTKSGCSSHKNFTIELLKFPKHFLTIENAWHYLTSGKMKAALKYSSTIEDLLKYLGVCDSMNELRHIFVEDDAGIFFDNSFLGFRSCILKQQQKTQTMFFQHFGNVEFRGPEQ